MTLQQITEGEPLFAAFAAHLSTAGLPADDLLLEPARYYALNPRGDEARAFGGLLPLGEDALLRSVIVPATQRKGGFGKAVVEELADLAAKDGAERVWLLTTDADAFFARFGWVSAERRLAPARIAATRQFSSVCPASAVLMCRKLD